MNKYLSFWPYVRYLRKKYYGSIFDQQYFLNSQIEKFRHLGIDYYSALDRLNAALAPDLTYDEADGMCSQHWIFFAGLEPKRILEIGTYDARFTKTLSLICPEAEIISCDLPDSSPCFNATYNRQAEKSNFIERRSKNLNGLKNVTFIQSNSFLLPGMALGKFDVVWVDGGHDYPDVAWDACNSFHMVDDGFILFDDIYRHSKAKNKRLVPDYNDSADMLNVLRSEMLVTVDYILKRLDSDPVLRKHIAVIKRTADGPDEST